MKDGRTHLAHKAKHAVDLSSGALVAVTLQPADEGDTTTIQQTLAEAQPGAQSVNERGIEEAVADKGYHSAASRNQRKPQRHGEHRENTEILGRFALPAVSVTSMRLRAQSRECHVGSSFPDRHRPLQVSNCLRPKTTGVGRNPSLSLSSIRDLCASVVCQNRRAPQRNHQLVAQAFSETAPRE